MSILETSEHYDRVRLFMQKAGQATPDVVVIPDEATRVLRARLILEEALETIKALGVDLTLTVTTDGGDGTYDAEYPFGYEAFKSNKIKTVANDNFDLVEAVDGCADISVVNIGTLIALGVPDTVLLETVDENNLAKFGPGGYRHPETGKWIKPADHTPPNIEGLLGDILAMQENISSISTSSSSVDDFDEEDFDEELDEESDFDDLEEASGEEESIDDDEDDENFDDGEEESAEDDSFSMTDSLDTTEDSSDDDFDIDDEDEDEEVDEDFGYDTESENVNDDEEETN